MGDRTPLKADPEPAPEDPRNALLLQDLKYWSDSFWQNEEAGERRVDFYIKLVTAVMGGFVALYGYLHEKKDPDPAKVILEIVPGVLVGLLLLGIVTFLRMVRRNNVSQEYKDRSDAVRKHILGLDFERIYPKPEEPSKEEDKKQSQAKKRAREIALRKSAKKAAWSSMRSFRNGGLAVMMIALNSFVAGLLAAFGMSGTKRDWQAGMIVFVLAMLVQAGTLYVLMWVNENHRASRDEKKPTPVVAQPDSEMI